MMAERNRLWYHKRRLRSSFFMSKERCWPKQKQTTSVVCSAYRLIWKEKDDHRSSSWWEQRDSNSVAVEPIPNNSSRRSLSNKSVSYRLNPVFMWAMLWVIRIVVDTICRVEPKAFCFWGNSGCLHTGVDPKRKQTTSVVCSAYRLIWKEKDDHQSSS